MAEEKSPLEISRAANEILKKRVGNLQNLAEKLIEKRIEDAAHRTGKVKPGAMRDLVARGKKVFRITEDGSAIEPRDEKGVLIFGKDAIAPIGFAQWAENLKESAPHFWEPEKKAGKPADLEGQLEDAVQKKDLQAQIRLKRMIHKKRQEV